MKVAVLTLLISSASLAAANPQFGLGGLLSGLVGGNRFGGGGRGPTQNLGPGAFGQQNNQQVDFNSGFGGGLFGGGGRGFGGGRGPTQNVGPGAAGQQNNQRVVFNNPFGGGVFGGRGSGGAGPTQNCVGGGFCQQNNKQVTFNGRK